jgi:excisionase family DNA binding protein
MIAPTADSNEDLLTAAEVASLLRMTSGWVYAETRANRIPHLRLGRYVRYRRSAIEQWMGEIETGKTLPPIVSVGSKDRVRRAAQSTRVTTRPGRITLCHGQAQLRHGPRLHQVGLLLRVLANT